MVGAALPDKVDAQGDVASQVTEAERKAAHDQFKADLAAGKIDLGPSGHSADPPPKETVADNRDMRDPELLGAVLLEGRMMFPDNTLSSVYDGQPGKLAHIPNYDPNPPDHAAIRLAELEARAAGGDRFAISLLAGETLAEDPVD